MVSNLDPIWTMVFVDIPRHSACIAGIIRLYYAQAINSADSTCKHFEKACEEPHTHPYPDNDIGGLVTSAVECSTGIISACIPTFGPLINRATNGHTNASSTVVWPSNRSKTESQHIRLSHTARNSTKGWSHIEASSERDDGEETMHLYERN